jgi:hypothetical protein
VLAKTSSPACGVLVSETAEGLEVAIPFKLLNSIR